MNQEVSKRLKATVGCSGTVTLRDERQRGTIEEVMKAVESDNFKQTVVLSEFKFISNWGRDDCSGMDDFRYCSVKR